MIHPTAEVSPQAEIGGGTRIWHHAQVRNGAKIGCDCVIGKGVYIDFYVVIGNRVKIQNGASIYHGATLEDGVFIGPHACLTNDKFPRAITPSGELKADTDWQVGRIVVKYGASVGAGAIVLPGVTIGRFAMVGAGAVVTQDVPEYGLAVGIPVRLKGFVCRCGRTMQIGMRCQVCDITYPFPWKEAVMIPIAKPLIGEEEKKAIIAVLESGMLAQGPMVEEFERAFAAMCGVRHAVATSSGTTALHLALLAHGIGPGDEVITSPFTFIASANSIFFVGAKPVFVDIDESSYNIDPALIEAKITPRTKALMPVHLFGNPCDMEAIMAIAAQHELVVIEDVAQAHGASINGKKVGSFGTGCFSFYATKNMTTGEGGMVTSDSFQVAEKVRLLRNHGMKRHYYHDFLGYNFRMTDLQAALGLAQLTKLEIFNERRIANARYLTEHLRDIIIPQVKDGYRHVFHQYTIRVRGDRDKIVEQLRKRGIGTGIYYPLPVHKQPIYQELGYIDRLPVAEAMSQEVLSLPVRPALSQVDLERIVEMVAQITIPLRKGIEP